MSEVGAPALAPTRRREKSKNNSKKSNWTNDDDEKLTFLITNNPDMSWSEMSKLFNKKTPTQLEERWKKSLNPNIKKGSWTKEEDEMIMQYVQEFGEKDWAKLAAQMKGRIGKQCRERWKDHLDPCINKNPWTLEEDFQLIELRNQIGNKWVEISKIMKGRSDNAIKNRWNSTLAKRLEYECFEKSPPKRGRPPTSEKRTYPKSADYAQLEESESHITSSIPTPQQYLISPTFDIYYSNNTIKHDYLVSPRNDMWSMTNDIPLPSPLKYTFNPNDENSSHVANMQNLDDNNLLE